jgi:MSHA biogenesis protein MshQ
MPVEAQFWSGKSWLTNTDDICTPLGPGNVTSGAWPREIRRATDPYLPTTKLVDGKAVISLAPTGPGFVSVCADLGNDNGVACAGTGPAALPWLQSKWPGGASYDNDPSATATFGVFSPEGKRGVYNREMY